MVHIRVRKMAKASWFHCSLAGRGVFTSSALLSRNLSVLCSPPVAAISHPQCFGVGCCFSGVRSSVQVGFPRAVCLHSSSVLVVTASSGARSEAPQLITCKSDHPGWEQHQNHPCSPKTEWSCCTESGRPGFCGLPLATSLSKLVVWDKLSLFVHTF